MYHLKFSSDMSKFVWTMLEMRITLGLTFHSAFYVYDEKVIVMVGGVNYDNNKRKSLETVFSLSMEDKTVRQVFE